MILDLLYTVPATVSALLIVGFTIVLSIGGLLLVHRVVPHPLRLSHNLVAGVLIAVVGVVYAVLLAFIAVSVWEDYNDADAIVHREASLAGNIYQDALNMRGPAGPKLRHLVQEYLTVVVDDEWPAMQRGEESTRAAAILAQLRSALFLYRFRGPLFTDVLERVNSLDDARRDRLINGNSGLQPVAWFVLLAGSALTICSCLLFAVPDLRLHALMTALVGASIALVLFLIVSFDYPFRGAVSISPRAFQAVQSDITQQEASPDPTPAPSAERPVPKPTLRAR